MAETRTKTRDVVLKDEVRTSPVDRDLARTTRRFLLVLLVIVAALVVVAVARAAPIDPVSAAVEVPFSERAAATSPERM